VRPDQDHDRWRRFECFTSDLDRLANWLQSCGVKTCPAVPRGFGLFVRHFGKERGFEVYWSTPTQRIWRTQDDVQESQWLLKLHTYGLLNIRFNQLQRFGFCAPTGGSGYNSHWSGDLCSTCGSTAADEHSVSKGDQRSERSDRTADRTGLVGGTRPRRLAERLEVAYRKLMNPPPNERFGGWAQNTGTSGVLCDGLGVLLFERQATRLLV